MVDYSLTGADITKPNLPLIRWNDPSVYIADYKTNCQISHTRRLINLEHWTWSWPPTSVTQVLVTMVTDACLVTPVVMDHVQVLGRWFRKWPVQRIQSHWHPVDKKLVKSGRKFKDKFRKNKYLKNVEEISSSCPLDRKTDFLCFWSLTKQTWKTRLLKIQQIVNENHKHSFWLNIFAYCIFIWFLKK